MKKMLFSSVIVVSVILGAVVYAISSPVFFIKKSPTDIEIDIDRLKNDIKSLVNTSKPRNYKNLSSLNEAAQYIQSEFEKLGLEVTEQKFEVEGVIYKNIITSVGPKDAERIIVGAHYDVCGEQPGADDNGSGVSGLLEIARQIVKFKPDLKYRLDFVAYTLEEPPFFRTEFMGSHVHAKFLKDNNIKVKAMICLEMIGYFKEGKKSQDYPIGLLKLFYPNEGDFITVVGKLFDGGLTHKIKKQMIKGSNLKVKSINAPTAIPGIDFSDHLNYWKYDFPAVMINNTGFYRNKNYHQETDTPETLDYEKMAEVIKGVTWAIINFK